MKATCRPLGNACISTGNGYAFDASAAGAAEAATSAAKSESSMRFLRGRRMGGDTRRESRNETLQINRQARQARQGGNVVSRKHFWVASAVAPTHRRTSGAAARG